MRAYGVILLLCCALLPGAASADIEKGINSIRQRGCEGKAGVRTALRRTRGLDEVAREWSKGGRLQQAIGRTDYRMANSASMYIEGARSEQAVLQLVATEYCENVLNPQFTEIGIRELRDRVWIVVAAPLTLPTADDLPRVARRVLDLVNEARARPRKCGAKSFKQVPPLELSPVLSRAALSHARDMSEHKLFEHRGSDGSTPADRATRAGYKWLTVGENIAVRAADADAVVSDWLESPGHCANIMSPQFREMGLGYFTDFAHKGDIYWAQVFATPR